MKDLLKSFTGLVLAVLSFALLRLINRQPEGPVADNAAGPSSGKGVQSPDYTSLDYTSLD